MVRAIVYQTNTGHTLEYARLLSEELHIPYYTLQEAKKYLSKKDEIVFLGWVFATKIQGLKKARKYNIRYIGAVGSYPNEEDYINSLKKMNPMNVPFFYLRGGVDFSKLKGWKKKLLQFVAKNIGNDHSATPDMKETFQGKNYVSSKNLQELILAIQKQR